MPRGGKREGAGRKPKGQEINHPDISNKIKAPHLNPRARAEISNKIKAEWLIRKLNAHIDSADGKMVPSAVTAALGLLRKHLPDLASVEHKGTIESKPAELLSDDELAAIASRGSSAADEAPSDPKKLN